MTVKEIIQKLTRSAQTERSRQEATQWRQYRTLLGDIVSGQQVEPSAVATILASLSKSPADLERDVETLQRRVEAGELLQNQKDLEQQRSQAVVKLEKAKAELAAAVAKHQPVIDENYAMVQSIDSRLNHQIGQARQTLIDTVMDPEIIAGIEQLRQDSQALADKIREIEPIREIARQKVESARRRVERLETLLQEDCHSRSDRETELGQLRKSLSYFGAELQRMTGEIETFRNQQAVIGQKISLLQQRSLEP